MNRIMKISGRLPLFFLMAATWLIAIYKLDNNSLWLDEARTYEISSQKTWPSVVEAVIQKRPYPPLYFLATHEILKFVPNEFGLRLLSAICGTMGIAAIFLLGQLMVGTWPAFLGCLVLLQAPSFLFHLKDGNCYAMLLCFGAFSTYFLFKNLEQSKQVNFIWFSFFSMLTSLTHLFGAVYIGSLILAFVFVEFFYIFDFKKFISKNKTFLIYSSISLFLICFEIWFISTHSAKIKESYVWADACNFKLIFKQIKNSYGSFFSIFGLVLQILGVFYFVCFNKKAGIFISTILLVHLFIFAPILVVVYSILPRYIFILMPAFIVLTSGGFALIPSLCSLRGWKWKPLKTIIFLSWFIFISFTTIKFYSKIHYLEYQSSWRQIASMLQQANQKNDIIFICADYTQVVLDYYYHGDVQRIGISNKVQANELSQIIDRNIIGKQRVWLILSHAGTKNKSVFNYLFHFKKTTQTKKGIKISLGTRLILGNPNAGVSIFRIEKRIEGKRSSADINSQDTILTL